MTATERVNGLLVKLEDHGVDIISEMRKHFGEEKFLEFLLDISWLQNIKETKL